MDAREKSFQSSAETSKLLITLGTGLLAAGLAFLNIEIGKATGLSPVSRGQKFAVASALVMLLTSIALGIWTQLAITQVLSEDASVAADVWSRRITLPFSLQISAFLVGVVAFVGYGIFRLSI